MQCVILESPFAASEVASEEAHIIYARRAMKDCLRRGEAPYASHLLYTQSGILDDTIPEEREWGIQAGFAWKHEGVHRVVVYTDYGISRGMKYGITDAEKNHFPIEYREIGKNP